MELQLEKLVELLVVVVRVEEVLVLVEAPSFLVAAAARFFSLSSPIDVRYRVQPFLFV